MSDSITIARPYAKAIFQHALAEKKLAEWSNYLLVLAQVVVDERAAQFISNPASTTEQHLDVFHEICAKSGIQLPAVNNLIALLATNKRLMLLPEIKVLFEQHRAEQEKTLEVDFISFSSVSAVQQQQLVESLSQRLQRKVSLNVTIDPSLLGGGVIRAGDLVIDGSVRGKLNKLSTSLVA